MALFPYQRWTRCLSRVARQSPHSLLSTEHPFGNMALRQAISRYLHDWRGLSADPDRILVTAGSIDGLEICLRTLSRSGDLIGLEEPCFPPLHQIARGLGRRIKPLIVDHQGAQPPKQRQAEASPVLLILTPSHQYPLGGAIPTARRLDFLRWADENRSWLIEDDYDSEFRYAGRPIPALCSFDARRRGVYVGSFSKVFSDGLRLGYVVVPANKTTEFERTLSTFGNKTSSLAQTALAEFMNNGDFYRHIRRSRRIYAERRRCLINLIDQRLSPWIDYHDHQAGMLLALRFREPRDDVAICEKASAKGLGCRPLSAHYRHGTGESGLLIGFCATAEEEMPAAIQDLEDLLRTN